MIQNRVALGLIFKAYITIFILKEFDLSDFLYILKHRFWVYINMHTRDELNSEMNQWYHCDSLYRVGPHLINRWNMTLHISKLEHTAFCPNVQWSVQNKIILEKRDEIVPSLYTVFVAMQSIWIKCCFCTPGQCKINKHSGVPIIEGYIKRHTFFYSFFFFLPFCLIQQQNDIWNIKTYSAGWTHHST
jgi:hypothetical protein